VEIKTKEFIFHDAIKHLRVTMGLKFTSFLSCLVGLSLLAARPALGQIAERERLYRTYADSRDRSEQERAARLALEIGEWYQRQAQPDQAEDMFTKALAHSRSANNNRLIALAAENLGDAQGDARQTTSALNQYNTALKLYQTTAEYRSLVRVYRKTGQLYYNSKDYTRATRAWEEGLKVAQQQKNQPAVLAFLELLARANRAAGDRTAAQKYQQRYGQETQADNVANLRDEQETKVAQLEAQIQQVSQATAGNSDSAVLLRQQLREERAALKRLDSLETVIERQQSSLSEQEVQIETQQGVIKQKESLLAEQQKVQRLYIAAGGILAALLLLSGFFAFYVNRKRAELKRTNTEISQKNKLIEKQKTDIEKEKNRTEELLLNILPREVADELKTRPDRRYTRSYTQVSVLFTDFEGFTQIAGRISPEELVKELDECFSAFDEICGRHRLEKIKTIGDAYMCAGGLPQANGTHAEDTVSAALEMLAFVERRRRERELRQQHAFNVRIGIHTGPVVAGVVGSRKFAYDIWGDTVNLAARLEQNGLVGRVNLSETTYELVKNRFYCRYRGQVEAKNKGLVDMYYVEERL
jgi:class 3 adenylate cyclase